MTVDGRIVVWLRATAVIGAGLGMVGSVMWITSGYIRLWYLEFAGFIALWALGLAVIVWLVVPYQPRNPVLWIMSGSALFAGTYVLTWLMAALSSGIDPVSVLMARFVPAEIALESARLLMVGEPAWILAVFPLLTFGLLLFPDGRFRSPRWRWFGLLALVGISLAVAGTVWILRPSNATLVVERIDQSIRGVGLGLATLTAVFSLVGLITKLRTSRGDLRQQLKWVLWGSTVSVIAALIAVPFQGTRFENAGVAPAYVAVLFLIGSYGVAIAKHRLYDIDLVISRTVVFGLMAGFITVVYALIVVGLGSFVGGRGGGPALPIAATAVVAIAFEPVRQVAQSWANRVVYGRRATPYQVLSDLTEKLTESVRGERILEEMTNLLGAGTGAERATVWLGAPGDMEPGATWPGETATDGPPDLESDGVFPVRHDDEIVGALEVIKARGSALSMAEKSLVTDLAGSAGLVIGYRRLNDSLSERATELEESRRRLVDAQDEERRRLERELRDGAERLVGALKPKVASARELASQNGAGDIEMLLTALSQEVDVALKEIRSLARGIYPPVLESEGLPAAISGFAAGAAVDIMLSVGAVGRYPPDIEAAVYFDVSEAVTNAVKHGTSPIRVELDEADGKLRFMVTDAGPGFDPVSANGGSGLANMKDRLEAVGGRLKIDSSPREKTRVCGEIPLAVGSA